MMDKQKTKPLHTEGPAASAEQIRQGIRYIERRQRSLWSSAILITLLLAVGFASFAFPGLLTSGDDFYSFYLNQTLRSLIGMVLIFNVYTIYQQVQIHRLHRQITGQIDQLARVESRTEEVYKLAARDSLTGLYNRGFGEQRLAEEISRSQRHARPLSVILFDLNDLKQTNDQFGHAAGDEMLKYFAWRLSRAIRHSDLAVRHGGDEFLAILPECRLEEVQHVLDRLKDLSVDRGDQKLEFTYSGGWTTYMEGESREELLQRADEALYANKRSLKAVPLLTPQD
ncbi:MAG: GGDEF domain-containing protein [Acidobacteriia bacterium]|nr:GGDEF domain-containing protein [Terriglobia bacterium]